MRPIVSEEGREKGGGAVGEMGLEGKRMGSMERNEVGDTGLRMLSESKMDLIGLTDKNPPPS
jgi:hypothetical protein